MPVFKDSEMQPFQKLHLTRENDKITLEQLNIYIYFDTLTSNLKLLSRNLSNDKKLQGRRSAFQIGGAPIRGESRKLLGVWGRSPRKKFSGVMPFFLLETPFREC